MNDDTAAALIGEMKAAHDNAQRREAWGSVVDVVNHRIADMLAYIAWLEAGFDGDVNDLRAMYGRPTGLESGER